MRRYFFEIKNRFILILYFFIFNFFFLYFYKEFLLFLVLKITCNNITLFSTSNFNPYFTFSNITDLFSIYLDLIVFCNNKLFFFFFFFQSVFFLCPAFYKTEFKKVFFFFKLSFFFFILSLLSSYFLVIPIVWDFFLKFQESLTTNYNKNFFFEIKLLKYLHFCKFFFIYCFLYFQLISLIVFVIFQVFDPVFIKKFRKIFHCLFLIFSTVLSSPDFFFSQFFGYFFLIAFFEQLFFLIIINLNFLKFLMQLQIKNKKSL